MCAILTDQPPVVEHAGILTALDRTLRSVRVPVRCADCAYVWEYGPGIVKVRELERWYGGRTLPERAEG